MPPLLQLFYSPCAPRPSHYFCGTRKFVCRAFSPLPSPQNHRARHMPTTLTARGRTFCLPRLFASAVAASPPGAPPSHYRPPPRLLHGIAVAVDAPPHGAQPSHYRPPLPLPHGIIFAVAGLPPGALLAHYCPSPPPLHIIAVAVAAPPPGTPPATASFAICGQPSLCDSTPFSMTTAYIAAPSVTPPLTAPLPSSGLHFVTTAVFVQSSWEPDEAFETLSDSMSSNEVQNDVLPGGDMIVLSGCRVGNLEEEDIVEEGPAPRDQCRQIGQRSVSLSEFPPPRLAASKRLSQLSDRLAVERSSSGRRNSSGFNGGRKPSFAKSHRFGTIDQDGETVGSVCKGCGKEIKDKQRRALLLSRHILQCTRFRQSIKYRVLSESGALKKERSLIQSADGDNPRKRPRSFSADSPQGKVRCIEEGSPEKAR